MCSGSAVVGVIGGVLGGASTLRGSSAAATGMREDANQAETEAQLAEIEKQQAKRDFARESSNVTLDEAQILGEGRASYAGSGVEIGSGSALEYDKAIQDIALRERAAIAERAASEEFAADVDIAGLREEAASLRSGADSVARSGQLGAGAAFFGSAAGGIAGQGRSRSPRRRPPADKGK